MSGYPNLFPAGFIEREETCDIPSLYRNQPSRETDGIRLNDFLTKYNPSGKITDYKFMELIKNLKEFSKNWNNIPDNVKKEIIDLLEKSDNDLSKDLKEHVIEHLKNSNNSNNSKKIINNLIEHFAEDKNNTNFLNLRCVNRTSEVWTKVLIAIIAVILSYVIFNTNFQKK